ncbi:RlpA-like double-psi beta-barrel-protein domain-containing protein-containing protein [Mycena latifolia]|nr:RlpA-like double-psi beta-barrel-protein domain-containing protein-containing protein [Mycena latifolia]
MFVGAVHSTALDARAKVHTGDGWSWPLLFTAEDTNSLSRPGTFFAPGLGACGKTNTPDDLIVAVSHELFDNFPGATTNPNDNPICGKQLKAHHGGKSVTVRVQDRCGGCAGRGDLDFTQAGFKKLAPLSVGRIHNVKWEFV